MAPTEKTILDYYLLVPAHLPIIISLEDFTAFFPRPQRSSPQVRALYRDLQRQRNGIVDAVSENIQNEVRRGKAVRREVVAARREAAGQEADAEDEVERALFGSMPGSEGRRHTLSSIVVAMEAAVHDLERQVRTLENEEAKLLQSVQQTVGNLSDLRYGRLANQKLPEQVLEGLNNLQDICEKKI